MLLEALKLALQAIRRNALRSFLTMLGIVIGVGAVIAMVTIGNGTTRKVTADLAKLGSNLLFVPPGQFGPGRASSDAKPFNVRDVEAMRAQLHQRARRGAGRAEVGDGRLRRARTAITVVTGTDNDYFITQDWTLTAGGTFIDGEVRGGSAACVIGQTVRDKLFGRAIRSARTSRVGNVSCEVIGVLERKGQSSFGTDQDDMVLMPLRAFQRRIAGNTDISTHLRLGEGRRRHRPRCRPTSNGCCASGATSRPARRTTSRCAT